MKLTTFSFLIAAAVLLTIPVSAPAAASKEMQDLQRDVAQLEDQIRTQDTKISSIQTMLQQALDTANKTSTSVTNVSSGVTQSQSDLKSVQQQLNSVTGLSVKVDNASNDISDIRSQISALVSTVNKQGQILTDINNQIKLMQAPPAAAPTADSGPGAPLGAGGPPPAPQVLYDNGIRDGDGGKFDLAVADFQQFVKLYPNDPNADKAQYQLGMAYYSSGKLKDAVAAFDSVIEQYDDKSPAKPGAYYMKGMALKKDKQPTAAIASFRAVVKDFPRSPEAAQARTQLTSMNASVGAPTPKKR